MYYKLLLQKVLILVEVLVIFCLNPFTSYSQTDDIHLRDILNVKVYHNGSKTLNYSYIAFSQESNTFLQEFDLEIDQIIWNNIRKPRVIATVVIDWKLDINERNGSYKIFLKNDEIIIKVKDVEGLFHARNTLKKLCEISNGVLSFDYIYDYPEIKWRYVHLILPKENKGGRILDLIDLAVTSRFNGVILQIKDRVGLDSQDKAYWSLSDIREIKEFCHSRGLKFILEIKFLTHQEISIFDNFKRVNKFTYDPSNEKVRHRVKEILKLISLKIKPDGIHIGFDELHGYRNSEQREKVLRRLDYFEYFEHLQFVSQSLSELTLDCYMWADMLLSPKKFSYLTAHGWPAKPDILKRVPKSIILCDWQYWHSGKLASYKFLSSNGNKVMPATWCSTKIIEDYSNFLKQEINYNQSAILCTTWPGALYNKRKKIIHKGCDLLTQEDIIEFSGRAFW